VIAPFIRAFGSYVPSHIVGNDELAAKLGVEAGWILSASGIEQRRYADSESVVDLGVYAANDCLKRANAAADSVKLLIVSSGSSERRFPGPAAEIGARLGLAGVPALDVPMASAGSIYGMVLASQLAPVYGPTLLIATEKMSTIVNREPPDQKMDKNTAILFGDGAGACLIDPREGVAQLGRAILHSDGANADNLKLEFGANIHMDGMVVIKHASQKIPGVIAEVLEASHIAASSIQIFLMHQANQNLIVRVAKALEVAAEKFYSNIASYGNTSSASMLIAAAEWQAASGFRPNEPVIFAGFGAGFHWGALLATGV
jgi:3-oxoacyl-[acyl-carrier-protein] synthase III